MTLGLSYFAGTKTASTNVNSLYHVINFCPNFLKVRHPRCLCLNVRVADFVAPQCSLSANVTLSAHIRSPLLRLHGAQDWIAVAALLGSVLEPLLTLFLA